MVRIQVLAKCVSVVLLLACTAHAQPSASPGEGPGSDNSRSEHSQSEHSRSDDDARRDEAREREAFFDALREFLPHKELFDLVEHAAVRQEIKLSDADADRIEKNVSKSFETIHAIREKNEGQGVSSEELKRQIREALAPLNEASYAILAQADFKRLLGIYVQVRSYRALLNDQVAKQIGLEGQNLDHFRQTRRESGQAIMEEMREAMKREIRNAPPGAGPPRAAFSKLFSQAEEKLDLKLSHELTQKQKDELEALKGAQFNLPKPPPRFGSPPGRSRGKSSSRGPGEKPPGSKGSSESESRDCKSDNLNNSARSSEVVALPSPRN